MAASTLNRSLQGRTVPLETILGIIECSVCVEVLKIPFKMCKTGHLMCASCMTEVRSCPLCQESLFLENSTCIKKLLAAVPHPCSHLANGCEIVVEPNESHETYCRFRNVKCIEAHCLGRIPVWQLKEHYDAKHKSRHVFIKSKSVIRWTKYKYVDKTNYTVPIATLDNFFWLEEKFKDGFFELTFHVYPIGELDENYFINIKFSRDDQGLSCLLKAYVNGDTDNTSCSMRIHMNSIQWFVDHEGSLVFEYDIFGKPKSK